MLPVHEWRVLVSIRATNTGWSNQSCEPKTYPAVAPENPVPISIFERVQTMQPCRCWLRGFATGEAVPLHFYAADHLGHAPRPYGWGSTVSAPLPPERLSRNLTIASSSRPVYQPASHDKPDFPPVWPGQLCTPNYGLDRASGNPGFRTKLARSLPLLSRCRPSQCSQM